MLKNSLKKIRIQVVSRIVLATDQFERLFYFRVLRSNVHDVV